MSMRQCRFFELGCDPKLEALEERICDRHEVDSFPNLWLGLLGGARRAWFIVHDFL